MKYLAEHTTTFSQPKPANRMTSLYRKLVLRGLGSIEEGRILLHEGKTCHRFGDPSGDLTGDIVIKNANCYRDILLGGSLGAAEAYIRGDWTSPDLVALIQVFARNMAMVSQMETGLAAFAHPLRRAVHFLHRNTRRGSRRNIAAHYDLSNRFFAAILDSKMMYSCAYFESDHGDLERASTQKLERVCRKLDLKASDRIVEIGTGWGGFAIYAASHFGCHVTTTTISRQQFDYAKKAIEAAGLQDRIDLLFADYRDLNGTFDKLVSIEMIEAVGHQYLPDFFKTCARLLKTNGAMLVQAITIPDDRYQAALKEVDFIKRYIFPGSFLPSIGAMVMATTSHTDLRLIHLEDLTAHYAKTLALWHRNFRDALNQFPSNLQNPEFIRTWTYYLAYCEGGFRERVIGNAQLLFTKPRRLAQTPLTNFASGESSNGSR